jgi:hypothetical protein
VHFQGKISKITTLGGFPQKEMGTLVQSTARRKASQGGPAPTRLVQESVDLDNVRIAFSHGGEDPFAIGRP